MRAEGASELKSTVLSPSFSQRATVASSEFRPERLAGRTQSARAAPSARTERVARPQAVSLSVLIIAVSASREGIAVSARPSMTQVAKGCAAGFLRYPAMACRQLQSPIERAVKGRLEEKRTQLSRVKYAMSWRVPRGKAMGA